MYLLQLYWKSCITQSALYGYLAIEGMIIYCARAGLERYELGQPSALQSTNKLSAGGQGPMLGSPWDLVTNYNRDSNATYNWGNPYKPMFGEYEQCYKLSYKWLLSPMGLQVDCDF